MRNEWYGDPRDFVKWGVLAALAGESKARIIVQVLMLRPDAKAAEIGDGHTAWAVRPEVYSHFRDVRNVKRLGRKLNVEIVLIDHEFEPAARERYFAEVQGKLRAIPQRKVVLLDPDTGLAGGRLSPKHVSKTEVRTVWSALHPGDWLVLYQHAWRQSRWREISEARFREACEKSAVVSYRGTAANDVALLAAKR